MSRKVTRRSHLNGKKIRTEKFEPVLKRTEKIANILSRKAKYCCVLCGKIFLIENKLNLHREKNHGELKKHHKTFPCPECKTSFTRKAHLKLHMESHQKKFEICTECDNRFASRANLKRHTRNIHDGGKEEKFKGKCEPDNDNNTDVVKETEALDAEENDTGTDALSNETTLDIINELEEFPLLEPADMEAIFSEFGLTTAEIIEQVFREEARYLALSQQGLHAKELK